MVYYEGRSINRPKLQNGAIPPGKIQNIRYVGNLILNIHTTFVDNDVIIILRTDGMALFCNLFMERPSC